ncbi:MAG: hypothetical protein PHG06_18345 [Parabacteroides sp.]|nr:hypothetical protein [Parabacteroides sp.]
MSGRNARRFLLILAGIILLISISTLAAADSIEWKNNTENGDVDVPGGIHAGPTKVDWSSRSFKEAEKAAEASSKNNSKKDKGNPGDIAILAALAGLLGIATLAGKKSKKELEQMVPKGKGVWVAEGDRETVLSMINDMSDKEYEIDHKGFIKAIKGSYNEDGSRTFSTVLDKLIASDELTAIGIDSGWASYDGNGLIKTDFTDNQAGVKVGDNGTDQVVILGEDEVLKSDVEGNPIYSGMDMVLAHELVHALRGAYSLREAGEDGVGIEEAYAIQTENMIRTELGYGLRGDGDTRDDVNADELYDGDGSYGYFGDEYIDENWTIGIVEEDNAATGDVYEFDKGDSTCKGDSYCGDCGDGECVPLPPSLGALYLDVPNELFDGDYISISTSCENADHMAICVTDPNGVAHWSEYSGGGSHSWSYLTTMPGSYQIKACARNTPGSSDPGTEYSEIEYEVDVINSSPVWIKNPSYTVTNTTAYLSWNTAVIDNQGKENLQFKVYNQYGNLLGSFGIGSTGGTISGLESDTQYNLFVKAIDQTGRVGCSDTISVKTLPAGTGDLTADQLRQQIVDLANLCIGNIQYAHLPSVILTNPDGTLKSGLQLDCSYFTSSLYYTIFGDNGNLEEWYEDDKITRLHGGGADRQSQMGTEVQNLKSADGSINLNTLKLGDLLFFDYGTEGIDYDTDPVGADRKGIYEHVAVYIGNGKYIDTATSGCYINSGISSAQDKTLNEFRWTVPVVEDVHDMILTARRIIQDDGSLFIV